MSHGAHAGPFSGLPHTTCSTGDLKNHGFSSLGRFGAIQNGPHTGEVRMESLIEDAGVSPVLDEAVSSNGLNGADSELMRRVHEDDHEAFSVLYRKYAWVVAAFFRHDCYARNSVDDLTQEVFARVWEHRRKIRPDGPIRACLLGFARNVLHERRAKADRLNPAKCPSGPTDSQIEDADPQTRARQEELAGYVRRHIDGLPSRQRQAIELVYLGDLALSEAARAMDCSVKTLQKNLQRAMRRLEKACVSPHL